MRRLAAALLVVAVAGCAYYNGLYNANRLADEARKAEREGRTGEARSLWARAAVKAESVATRFPESRWHDDALLLWGQSLRRIDACSRAVRPLGEAGATSDDRRIAEEARLGEGECRLVMREPDSAVRAVTPVAGREGPRRADALLLRARAHLAAGHYGEALADAEQAGGEGGAFIRANALASVGRVEEASGVLHARLPGSIDGPAWIDALAVLGAADPEAAERITRELTARADLPDGLAARLWLADGERWIAARRFDRAVPALDAAQAAGGETVEGRSAEAHLLMAQVGRLDDPDAVPPLLADVRRVTAPGGRPVQIAGTALNILPRVMALRAADANPARLFLIAETVRDTLGAPALAAALFLEVSRLADDDVLAPKALVAALATGAAPHDSVLTALHGRYATSVYALALRGEAGERYRVVEDSLARVFASLRTVEQEGPRQRGNVRGINE